MIYIQGSSSEEEEQEEPINPPPKKKGVSFSKKKDVRTYYLQEDEIKAKVSDEKFQTMVENQLQLRKTPKHKKDFKTYFPKKVAECQRLLSKPTVDTLTNRQRLGAMKSLRKVINMKLRVNKI